MPNYYNPYNFYPVGYANQMGYTGMQTPQMMSGQSYAAQPGAQQPKIMEWVEGEVGAKAYQMPAGWPANQPIPLWDSTDTIIWLKSYSLYEPKMREYYEKNILFCEKQSFTSSAVFPFSNARLH